MGDKPSTQGMEIRLRAPDDKACRTIKTFAEYRLKPGVCWEAALPDGGMVVGERLSSDSRCVYSSAGSSQVYPSTAVYTHRQSVYTAHHNEYTHRGVLCIPIVLYVCG